MKEEFGYSPKQAVTQPERAEYLRAAVEFTHAAGEIIVPHFRNSPQADNKAGSGRYDPVTLADRGAEQLIRAKLADRYPEHGVFGEEAGFEPGNGLTWVIDPIDGTRGFITGMLHWGVLLALFDGETPIVGVMHQPVSNETLWGDNDAAGYEGIGGRRTLEVRQCEALTDAVLASTGPQYFAQTAQRDRFDALQACVRFTRFGGDCYSYAMLAMGQLDLVVEAGLKPYDIQALMPIVRGAGGIVTTWEGGDAALGGAVVAAGDPRIHEAALALLSQRSSAK